MSKLVRMGYLCRLCGFGERMNDIFDETELYEKGFFVPGFTVGKLENPNLSG